MPTLGRFVPSSSSVSAASAGSGLTAYRTLEARFARLAALEDATAILHWDQATMMPPGGGSGRAEQLAVLQGLHHDLLTAPEVADLLATAGATPTTAAGAGAADDADAAASSLVAPEDEGPDPALWRAANLREMARQHRRATALPRDLVEALARAAATCEGRWREARRDAAFAGVAPALATLVDLTREAAAAKGAVLGLAPYDALLDDFEPGLTEARVTEVFADLDAFLRPFLDRVLAHQAQAPTPTLPPGPFPQADQERLARAMMTRLGFAFDRGRLDVSAHPFCGGTPSDVRLTTRYDEADFTSALMGVIHETGHALYEQGLPLAWAGQPVGRARGMAAHESQSLLWEMQVCRSRPMLASLVAEWRATFGGSGPAWAAEAVIGVYTRVAPGFIRVDADEVTYPAHVMLRTRLEADLIAGRLAVADLPQAWAAEMTARLGLTPPDDRLGCLQDIHWFDGAFGYFPTYTLGAMAAAQIFAAAVAARPEIPDALAQGQVAPLRAWLAEAIWARASRPPTTDALLIEATGRPLEATAFKDHLTRRYLPAAS